MDIHESLRQILHRSEDRLGDLFYGIFLRQYPEVRVYFDGIDLHRQATLLMSALQVIVAHSTHRYPASAAYLEILGNRHYRWGIEKTLYPKFRDALLLALEEFHGRDWNFELSDAWEQAIDLACEAMFKGYVDAVLHV